MPDYSKGKIYKIENDIDDEVYIGSTVQPLCERWGGHKREINRNKYKCKLYQKIREYGVEHFKIVLVEEYPCDNVEQLKAKEAEYIRQMGTLNHTIPNRTKKQYWEDKKEQINENRRQTYQTNKEVILERNKQYRETNKEQYLERKKQQYECQCGSVIRKDDKARHERSQKHNRWLEQQNA